MEGFPINDFLSGIPSEGISTPLLNGYPYQQPTANLTNTLIHGGDKKRSLDILTDGGKKKKSKKKEEREDDDDPDKKRVAKACVFCQRSHMSCDSGRPCKRCVDRGVPELCVDPIPKRRGRRRKFLDSVEEATLSTLHTQGQDATLRIAASVPPSNPMLSPVIFNGMTPSLNSPPTPGSSPSNNNSSEPDPLGSNDNNEESVSIPPNLLSELFFSPMDQFGNIMSERQSFQNEFDQQQRNQVSSSCVSDAFAAVHLRHLRDDKSELMDTPSTVSRQEWLVGFVEYIRKRAPDEAEQLVRYFSQVKPHIAKMKQTMSPQSLQSILKDFETGITFAKNAFEHISVPTIVWEKCGVIHYYNKPFKNLTGFSVPVPTRREKYELYNMLSTFSLKRFLFTIVSAYTDGTTTSLIVPCEWLSYGKYIDVMACVSIKRDVLGLPLVLTGHILPIVFSPILDVQLHTISNRPLEGMLVQEKMQREHQLAQNTKQQQNNPSNLLGSSISSSTLFGSDRLPNFAP